ncbi:MAG: ABC-three component system middle component 7 [Bacillota bacterium]
MKLPNKIICYNDSIIPKLILILEMIDINGVNIQKISDEMHVSIVELIDALDALYVLNKIDITEDGKVYVI